MGKMDIRTVGVYIARDWLIQDEAVKQGAGKEAKCEADFIDFAVDKQGRIITIGDIDKTPEREFKALKEDKRFAERCDFRAYDYYAKNKLIAEFEGDFIDALLWVNHNMRRIQQEHGENLGSRA
jgi:hypothetical protein